MVRVMQLLPLVSSLEYEVVGIPQLFIENWSRVSRLKHDFLNIFLSEGNDRLRICRSTPDAQRSFVEAGIGDEEPDCLWPRIQFCQEGPHLVAIHRRIEPSDLTEDMQSLING